MKLQEILAISGTPGLHRYVAQGRGGIIVESLVDNKRTMVPGSAKVSALGEIAIFTQTQEVALADVFTSIFKANKGPVAISSKSTDEELAKFIVTVLPDYDTDRVHMSDVKKIAAWYNVLVNAGMTEFSVEEEDESTAVVEEAPAKGAKKAKASDASADEDAPVKKKTTAKKISAASAVKAAAAPKASAPKAGGAKVKATRSTTARKSQ